MHKWKGNIFKEMAYKGLNLIKMAENWVQWQAVLIQQCTVGYNE